MLRKEITFIGLTGLVWLAGCGGQKEETTTDTTAPAIRTGTTPAPSSAGTTTPTSGGGEAATEPKTDAKPAAGGKEVTTASGLKYEDIKVGTGASPQVGQIVTVNYTGTLLDGKKFDSSFDHIDPAHPKGQPFEFPIGAGQVIKGWDEGVLTMKVGGRRKLTIPADLAYGDRAMGNDIPANSTLVFDVELLDIK